MGEGTDLDLTQDLAPFLHVHHRGKRFQCAVASRYAGAGTHIDVRQRGKPQPRHPPVVSLFLEASPRARHVQQRIQPRSRRPKVREPFDSSLILVSFIKQYYEMFAKNPAELHRFYKDESSFSHAEGHQVELLSLFVL